MALRDLSLGELAITIPRATLLFRQHDMDFCCGGKQTLLRVATKKNLNVDELEAALENLKNELNNETAHDWRNTPLAEITPFIVKRYHDRHREQLPEPNAGHLSAILGEVHRWGRSSFSCRQLCREQS
jgi:regulator of cell morphogenesis and NO signaling